MATIPSKVLDDLRAGQKSSFEYHINDNLYAVVSFKPDDKVIKIGAYLRTRVPKATVKEINPKTATNDSLGLINVDVENLCRKLYIAYNKLQEASNRKTPIKKAFAELVLSLPNIFDPENYKPYISGDWKESTVKAAVNYYANTFGSFYEMQGYDVTTEDLKAMRDDKALHTLQSKYGDVCTNAALIETRKQQILSNLNENFRRARCVQRYLLANHPEIDWPAAEIPVDPYTKTPSIENIKTVTYEIYVKFVTLLVRCAQAHVPYAYACAGTGLMAMRIGESCAPLIGDFNVQDTIGLYYVDHQIDDKRERTDRLKRPASYRYLAFGPLMISLIELRKAELADWGYTAEEANNLPFASAKAAPEKFLSKFRASTFAQELLVLAGCDKKWLEEEAKKAFAASVASGDADDLYVSSHELRSTIATFCGNGGMPMDMLDAFLGHANDKVNQKDYANFDMARRVVSELERCIPYGSLCPTKNSAYHPMHVDSAVSFRLEGNLAYEFEADVDTWIDLDVCALEPMDAITITLPAGEESALQRRTVPDILENKQTRPVLAQLPDSVEIERWIAEAHKIDLTEISRRYGGSE